MDTPTVPNHENTTVDPVGPAQSPYPRHAERRAELGLRNYIAEVAAGLGLGTEAACWEITNSATAYLALDGQLPGIPNGKVALIWDSRHGWAIGIEYGTAADPLVLGYLDGTILPAPRRVVDFVKATLAGCGDGRWFPPDLSTDDLTGLLAEYAPRAAA